MLEINYPQGVQIETLWEGAGLPFAGSLIMLRYCTNNKQIEQYILKDFLK